MKKFLTKIVIAVVGITALCSTVFAAEIPYMISYDYTNNAVTISGTVDKSAAHVMLQVLAEGKNFEDLAANPADSTQVLYRYQQDITDGTFSFTVGYDAIRADTYAAKLVTDGVEDATVFGVKLVSGEAYSSALSDLKKCADAQDVVGFKKCIETQSNELGFDLSLYRNLSDTEDALKPYMNYVRGQNLLPEQGNAVIRDFISFVLMAALEENKTANIKPYMAKASVGESEVAADFVELADTVEKQEYVTSKMVNKTMETFSAFEDALKEGLILGEIRFASGYGGVKNVLTKYGAVVGITGTASADVYKAMCGESYKDASALLTAYNKLNESSARPSGGSSNGGGSKLPTSMNATYPNETQTDMPAKFHTYFHDIDGVEWATESILALADMKIINGKSEGYFKPNDCITREEFAKILVCTLKYQEEKYGDNMFSDVNEDDWFCPYVNIGYCKGLMKGVGDGKFGVGEVITRQDMVVMLYNALRSFGIVVPRGTVTFEDKDEIADYAVKPVESLYEMGIINGVSETKFDALGTATRAQAAKVVYGFLKYLQ